MFVFEILYNNGAYVMQVC